MLVFQTRDPAQAQILEGDVPATTARFVECDDLVDLVPDVHASGDVDPDLEACNRDYVADGILMSNGFSDAISRANLTSQTSYGVRQPRGAKRRACRSLRATAAMTLERRLLFSIKWGAWRAAEPALPRA